MMPGLVETNDRHAHRACAPRHVDRGTALAIAVIGLFARDLGAQTLQDLSALSLEELSKVEITSVSKRPEPLSQAPASIYVITAEEIRRSGVATLEEALRLAPNLEVARVNSQSYSISARGLNSVNASNKLLVLIDGRSIYTPFFSSVFWDEQEVMLADIERIEVISGPGGVLWGANAMNGVINVITKTSGDTQGGLVDAKLGDFIKRGAARWGGKVGETGTYRTYLLGMGQGDTRLPNGSSAMDAWTAKQAGFRSDFAAWDSTFTVQGDIYENIIDSPGGRRNGGDLLGRWNKRLQGGSLVQVQVYYDEFHRSDVAATGGGSSDLVKTFDVQAQQSLDFGESQQIVWGIGQRVWTDRFVNTANPFTLVPESQTLNLTNIFAQDTIALGKSLKTTLGVKFEYSTFTQWAVMPTARIGWQATDADFLWVAISRAVRPPSRLERDLTAPGIVVPSPDFQSEKLIAYEAGWRTQIGSQASASVSLFYNDYTDLRTTSPTPIVVLPVHFGNGLEGYTYGADAWGTYRPLGWWRLDAGVTLLHKDFHLKPGQMDIAGVQTVLGHDPNYQYFLRSYMDLPYNTQLYVGLRYIGALPDVRVGSYFEADAKLSWQVTRNLELSLNGSNLVHAFHAEASEPPIHEIPRNFYFGLRWSF